MFLIEPATNLNAGPCDMIREVKSLGVDVVQIMAGFAVGLCVDEFYVLEESNEVLSHITPKLECTNGFRGTWT